VTDFRDGEHPPGTLALLKPRTLVDRFLQSLDGLGPRQILDLGTYEGGSACLWFEAFRPEKLVTIDISSGPSRPEFAAYEERTNARLRSYWGVSQADTERLTTIVADEFEGPLDLVIDDASHWYEPTRASFELLFPLLRPGGLYVLEDWDWEFLPEFQAPHPWSEKQGLLQLIEELARRIRDDVKSLSLQPCLGIVEQRGGSFQTPVTH
jgi:predicted O-methyltransferase YrrM